ncbi:MAG: hypothetical protein R3B41_03400 [Candidatus Doudnabacteria bacterium]
MNNINTQKYLYVTIGLVGITLILSTVMFATGLFSNQNFRYQSSQKFDCSDQFEEVIGHELPGYECSAQNKNLSQAFQLQLSFFLVGAAGLSLASVVAYAIFCSIQNSKASIVKKPARPTVRKIATKKTTNAKSKPRTKTKS